MQSARFSTVGREAGRGRVLRPGTRALGSLSVLAFCGFASTALSQEAQAAPLNPVSAVEAQAQTVGVGGGGQSAPMNPEFVAELEARKTRGVLTVSANDGQGRGYAPSPLDLSYLKAPADAKPLGIVPRSFPSSYDLRTLNRVTAVRNQGSEGTCWAHAAFGSMESCLMPGETRNFSENNLANLHGFDYDGWVDGGNGDMSTAYFVRWNGPVDETSDPYPSKGTSSSLPPVKHVQDVLIIPAKASPTANDLIKQALTDYGGICTAYYDSSSYYRSSTYSYYYNGANGSSHLVTIVGWDDNFSSANFGITPPGNGAYIVKNSWGTGWGSNGYYYVSYYDTRFGSYPMYVFPSEPTTRYKTVYQYDDLGRTSNRGYSSTTGWGANIFTASTSERLGAVGFYAASMNTSYEVYVYTGVSDGVPRSGTLAASTSGACTYAGYHTIPLNVTVPLTAGQRFSIVVKFTTPNYNYPIPIEPALTGYSSAATTSAKQSYIGAAGTSWYDTKNLSDGSFSVAGANVCIKGYLATDQTLPTVTINQAVGQADPASGSPVNFTVVFSEAVTNFAPADVAVSGTAPGTKSVVVTGSGTTYSVAVSGMTGGGTVIATIAASVATDAVGNPNAASTSSDNTITFTLPTVTLVTSTSGVTVPEGSTATFQVKLSAQPAASTTVAVTRSAGDTDISVTGGAGLTFSTSNWSSYQMVTLAAAEDADTTNGTATVTCSASGLASVDVAATESDNDAPAFQIAGIACGAGTFTFNAQTPSGLGYTLQRSTNLVDWLSVMNYSSGGTFEVLRDAQVPTCFYRLRSFPDLVENGAATAGQIDVAGDSDWYCFVVTTARTYTFTTALGTLLDSVMFLYGPASQTALMTYNDDYGSVFASQIVITLTPGTYYIKVNGYASYTGTYTLQVTR